MQRIDAIKAAARNLDDLVVDTVPASLTGSTIQADRLIHPLAEQLQGFTAYIYSGAGVGQERTVGSFNPARNELVFPQVFASIPSVNSNFILTEHFNKQDYDNALDRLIGKARTKHLEEKVATLALVATQYEYAVPSGFEWISHLRLVPSASSDYADVDLVNRIFELPPHDFRIERNVGGSYLICFDSRKINLDELDDYNIKVMGQVKPEITATDNATIPVELEEYVVFGASMLLASQRIDAGREWQARFYMFRDLFNPLEDYIFRYGRGKKVT